MATVTPGSPTLAPAPEPDFEHFEIIDGRRVELPPRGARESILTFHLGTLLHAFGGEHQLGQATVETLFDLRPAVNRSRKPDVAFVSFGRWAKGREIPEANAWEIVPDLAAEIVSPTDPADELMARVDEYFWAGVRLVWVVYPRRASICALESPTAVRILRRGDDLDGGAVPPGFRMPLASLFGGPEPEAGPPGNHGWPCRARRARL